nr:YdhK family protein [Paenibacillus daejeonensis]
MLLLGACGKAGPADHDGHDAMNHSSSGDLPEGLQTAAAPRYPAGSRAIIRADHMPGMDGAEATIVGAYETIVYIVSYSPQSGGEPVTGHQWVIHEEIADAAPESYRPGDQVTLEADHMAGMEGAVATIDAAEATTVYMVDYEQTTDGEQVRNHKWVTESELADLE